MLGLIRNLYIVLAAAFLGGGYGASQIAYFQGEAAAHARRMDQPSVHLLAAILLLGAIALRVAAMRTGVEEGQA